MRISYVLCFLLVTFSMPARAGDVDFKQEAEKIASARRSLQRFNGLQQ
jgi:hypothetical protein